MRALAAPVLLAALALAGCAAGPAVQPALGTVELTEVPFFPQTEYQCGPAALATVLAHEGLPVTAEQLTPAVYVEGLRGSLQPELLGATRRHGFVPYVLPPTPEALFEELGAGRPVLVLQNLGLERMPIWHYAVVVGYEAERGRVILRSGTEQRRGERLARFMRSWRLGGHWAFVALEPGTLPATDAPDAYVRAVAAAEPLLPAGAAERAYASGVERWPGEPLVLFTAAAHGHAAERFERAEALYRQLLEVAPHDAAARNNLAHVLADRGCYAEALREAREALALAGGDALSAAVADTVATLEARLPDTPSGAAACH